MSRESWYEEYRLARRECDVVEPDRFWVMSQRGVCTAQEVMQFGRIEMEGNDFRRVKGTF